MMASSMMADLARVSQANMNNQEYKQPSPTAVSGASSPTELDKQATMRDDVCQVIHYYILHCITGSKSSLLENWLKTLIWELPSTAMLSLF